MAHLSSPFNISGTYGNIVVYTIGGNLYARTKSSLTGSRFRKDPAFAKSREKAKQFGEAARLAKAFYSGLPKELKWKGLFGKLTGLVQSGLQLRHCKAEIIMALNQYLGIEPPSEPIASVTLKARKNQSGTIHLMPVKINNASFSNWQVTHTGCLIKICNKKHRILYRKAQLIVDSSP